MKTVKEYMEQGFTELEARKILETEHMLSTDLSWQVCGTIMLDLVEAFGLPTRKEIANTMKKEVKP
jgi:hypothetical protein